MRIMGNLAAKTLFRKVFQAKNTVLGKGLPKKRQYRDKQLEYYYLFFCRFYDKIKPERPYSLYAPKFLEDIRPTSNIVCIAGWMDP